MLLTYHLIIATIVICIRVGYITHGLAMSLAASLSLAALLYHLLLRCITCRSCEAIALAGPKPAREKWLARLASGLKFGQPPASAEGFS